MTGDLLQTANSGLWWRCLAFASAVDHWLWRQRESLFLWVPVLLGSGIGMWFALPGWRLWAGVLLIAAGISAIGFLLSARWSMIGRCLIVAGGAFVVGLMLIWWKAERVAAPVLERPVIVAFSARVERREALVARGQVRLLLRTDPGSQLPPLVRVTMADDAAQAAEISVGEQIGLRARLVPPPRAALPGGYDFARTAWFQQIGAVGSVMGRVNRARDARAAPGLRERLSAHITTRMAGSAGAIASALATGDQGGIADADAKAMRAAGLTHLLSISGLHVTAAVGGAMWLLLRLLALFPRVGLRMPLLPVAAAGGALVGIGYTLLTGAQVPTVRSLVASLLVVAALVLGREAMTMRLVAAGALVVLVFVPEALVGPSFQLSFAAVTAIVALHGSEWMHRHFSPRDEHVVMKMGRSLASLLLTGLVVEAALTPIAFYHFHRAGVYGALANIVAIPLTTLVIMPAEALALTLDSVGAGAPAWWIAERALTLLLWIAHLVAAAPGAVATIPSSPIWMFLISLAGGLWLALWQGWWRLLGLVAVAVGMALSGKVASPDIIVTGDGRHVATRQPDGSYSLLRSGAGEFVRDQLNEAAGADTEMVAVADTAGARCSPDFCRWSAGSGANRITILAARSSYYTEWQPLVTACARADIVIADRKLPQGCKPRWLKADRALLTQTGGLSIRLDPREVKAVRASDSGKPWEDPPTIAPPRPPRVSDRRRPTPSGNAATGRRVFPE